MKKLMCLGLGVSLIGTMIVVAGCGGGGGLGTILGAAFVIAIVASTGGAGGAGAVPFAASLRERPAIRGSISISASKLQFKVTPYTNGTAGTPIFVDVATSTTNTELVGTASLNISGSEYMVELVRGDSAEPIVKSMIVNSSLDNGDVVNAIANASTTAGVLVYSQWVSNNPITPSYSNFENNLTANAVASISAIGKSIENFINGAPSINSVSLSDYSAAAASAATLVTNVINPETINGWWILKPSNSNEYAGIHATGTHVIDRGSMFGGLGGSYDVQSNGGLLFWIDNSVPAESVDALATMTSTTTMTYEARNRVTHAVIETGSAEKVSNPAACAGTWTGTVPNGTSTEQITIVIDSNGLIQSFSGSTVDALPQFNAGHGFVVTEAGKVTGYASFSDQYQTQARFFGTISGSTFSGTIESTSTAPEGDTPNGTITMTKQ